MLYTVGSRGNEVKQIQEKVGVTADGIFGSGTKAAVEKWQSANGVAADGMVGPNTWAKMFPPTPAAPVANDGALALSKLSGAIPDNVLKQIPDTAKTFNITSNLRLAHFMAQCAHESGSWKFTVENMNYSETALKAVFGKYFPGDTAASYARQPAKIGARVYANRMGNGDEASGDGYTYRGRGYIQLTGKDNYSSFSKYIGTDCVANPDAVATDYPLASAAFFFNSNNLWTICDQGADEATVKAVTKRVNGGYNGLDDRLQYFNKYWGLIR